MLNDTRLREPIRFGDFEVLPGSFDLRKSGNPVRIQDQPYRVLLMLLEHAGETVTQDQLKAALAPSAEYGDFDHMIRVSINKLRSILADSATSPRFIETVHGHGYRFIAGVEHSTETSDPQPALEDGNKTPPEVPPLSDQPRRTNSLRWFMALGSIVLLALALLATFHSLNLHDRLFPPQIRSLAVLPLQNLSHQEEQDYFADGMTEALISELSRMEALKVISMTSVMRLKGTTKTIPQIAEELNVDGIVEGSVLRDGDRVRIRTRLVNARYDRPIWSESYDRDVRDTLDLQTEVAHAIAAQIQLRLNAQDKARAANVRRVSPDVLEAYLRGRYFANRRNSSKSIEEYQRAIRGDPGYAPAYAGLALEYVFSLPGPEQMPKARANAQKAIELDESLSEAHTALGTILSFLDWQWSAADKEYQRALQLDPGSALAHTEYAYHLFVVGRMDEALAQARRAKQLDPLSLWVNMNYGRALYFQQRYDDAITQFTSTLVLDPDFSSAYYFRGFTKAQKGLYDEAIADLVKSRELIGQHQLAKIIADTYASAGYPAALSAWARYWEKGVADGTVLPTSVAQLYAQVGETDLAFQFLEQGFREHSRSLPLLNVDPQWNNLRSDPRFKDLLKRMNLPP